MRKLRKVTDSRYSWFSGVCAGVAYWMGFPTWIVRLVWFITYMVTGSEMAVLYIILWIFLPKWEKTPEDYLSVTGD
ncbi:MAG: PspC domain-containing protein [Candidatus Harrisonbacteria bacterium]|nr:PspC domain-containing protein [Candidatus Harrisonbacteria bacterium]